MSVDPSARNDAFIDADLIRAWLASGLVWLLVFPTLGALVSTKFNYPEFLGDTAWLAFGRLRPIHVNGVIWGAFSTLFIGLAHYVVPRLCGVRLAGERLHRPLLWLWNANLIVFALLLARGANRGWEVGELPLMNVLVLFVALVVLTAQYLITIRRRVSPPLYVSLWYLIAAFVWTDANLVLLMLGPTHLAGINNAAAPLSLLAHRRLGGDDRDRVLHDAHRSGLDRAPEFLRHDDRALARSRANLPAKLLIVGAVLYLHRLFPGLRGSAALAAATDALHRFRGRPFPHHGLRDVRDVGDRGHRLRLAAGDALDITP